VKLLIAGGGTGGHLMPALALAEALVEENAAVEPVLVGAKRGVEAAILPSRHFRHHLLSLQPIYRRQWWKNLRWPFLALKTRHECLRVLEQEQPALVLGTGGYAAGPVLYWSLRRGLPVAIQEQNAYPGLTTRWLARKANQVYLGFPEASEHLRPGSTTSVHEFGNPITPPPTPRPERSNAKAALGIHQQQPVVLVVGGSQGASAINKTVAEVIHSDGLADVVLLWSTGHNTWNNYAQFHEPPRRIVKAFWDPVAEAYAAADVVVSRAGAMTTAELCAWGLPSILIPLPSAAADHQTENAKAMALAGAAVHIQEPELTSGGLMNVLSSLLSDASKLEQMTVASAARGRPDAARKIAREVLRLVS
jgi:UDP-N-acetylglucosamine--N-acetylmuramyl-(pentapeptide) pyrophosphoryl-undecaprenol N-acetylglucosamine transferase